MKVTGSLPDRNDSGPRQNDFVGLGSGGESSIVHHFTISSVSAQGVPAFGLGYTNI